MKLKWVARLIVYWMRKILPNANPTVDASYRNFPFV
jgi:hypothetical protein